MDPEKIAQLAVNYGLGIVLSIGMAVFMGWLLKYVLKQNELREQRLSDLIIKDLAVTTKSINDHDERSNSAIKNIEEANRRQREEQEEHKKLLQQIEQENDRRRDAQQQIILALTGINTSLAELNNKEIYLQKKRTA